MAEPDGRHSASNTGKRDEGAEDVWRKLALAIAALTGLVVWAALGALGLDGMARWQPQAALAEVAGRGTATISDCREAGGIGFRTGWFCVAEATWEDGTTSRVEPTPEGQFTPADQGRELAVVRRLETRPKGGDDVERVYRADFEPSLLLGFGSIVGALGAGALVTLVLLGAAARIGKKDDTKGGVGA
ncbi:DUF6346 domain-containing protein [Actinosynnema pretiosum]|uniref:Uncharacterized protein n=1 Tax=Actinosynnema pretiosum TaxID=42197 RepID=A0A290Z8Y2_9PSEU|nr:DUF6346 domain-containing protein [Actinosynnema pretiosum]ATE55477.1 hypothetical protein CNX65_21125 [Actinosynnema pretiosum]